MALLRAAARCGPPDVQRRLHAARAAVVAEDKRARKSRPGRAGDWHRIETQRAREPGKLSDDRVERAWLSDDDRRRAYERLLGKREQVSELAIRFGTITPVAEILGTYIVGTSVLAMML